MAHPGRLLSWLGERTHNQEANAINRHFFRDWLLDSNALEIKHLQRSGDFAGLLPRKLAGRRWVAACH